ncbi:hypothetical protein QTP70_001477 [Hemibagrus guttatus]|uniref:Integrase catalytic domain-containing protein n=1 Tax=Hemibagrus guttatus TaxID=175788 RepID=A0AAE0UUN8_9TELE|nr:hypothetical protein QTP70_001477 [Hemibagrus guttatus]
MNFMCLFLFAPKSFYGSMNPLVMATPEYTAPHAWWPSMTRDSEDFMRTCSMCAQTRSSRQLPEGLLEPLLIPSRPWSHVAVDFITDLPSSQGFTMVMVTTDRFSKACKLIPLKGLPTAFQMATTLFHHVFRNHGLPGDIVSDRGPQFTSRVWKAFCERLGIQPQLFPWSEDASNVLAVDDWARRSQSDSREPSANNVSKPTTVISSRQRTKGIKVFVVAAYSEEDVVNMKSSEVLTSLKRAEKEKETKPCLCGESKEGHSELINGDNRQGAGEGGVESRGQNEAGQAEVMAEYASVKKVRKLERGRKQEGSEEENTSVSSSSTVHRTTMEPFHKPNMPKGAVSMSNGEVYIWKSPEESNILSSGPSLENGHNNTSTSEIFVTYSTVSKPLKKEHLGSTQQTSQQIGSGEGSKEHVSWPSEEHCYETVGEKTWSKVPDQDPAYATIKPRQKREIQCSSTLKPKKRHSGPLQGPERAMTCENFYETIGNEKEDTNTTSTTILTFDDGMKMYATGL